MAIENTATRRSFDTDGISRAFAVNWRVLDAADITVVKENIASGDAATLVLGRDYTVSLSTDGAMVTALTVPPAGHRWHIIRQTAPIQPVRLPEQGALPSARVETTLDRQAMVGQEAQRDLARALTAPIHEAADLQLPTARRRAERLLTFGADGLPQASTFTADQVAATIDSAPLQMLAGAVHAFATDGISTLYSLPAEWGLIYAAVTLLVNIGGIGGLTAGYTLTSGANHGYPGRTVIIFAAPLPAHVRVEVRIPPAAAQPMVDDTTQIIAAGSDTPRPLRERAADFVNILNHGGRGDGLTDNRAAIARAAAVAAATGAAVEFPPGLYITSPCETAAAFYLHKGATLKAMDGLSGHLVTITAHGVRLYGPGTVDGNKAGAPAGLSCVYARECHGLEIDGLTIRDAARHGIGLYDATGLRVRNVRVSGATWAQVQVYVEHEDLSDVVIEGVQAEGAVPAVVVSNVSSPTAPGGMKTIRGVHFRRCTAADAGSTTQVVMEIWNGSQIKAFDCTFEACQVTGGVFAYSFDGVLGGTMVDCHAIGPAQIGYELANSPGSRVANNTLDIMGRIGNADDAAAPAPLTAVSISGASANAEVSDLMVIDSVGGGKVLRGIYVGDTAHGVTISRNRVLATVQQGIVANGVRHMRVVNQNIFASVVADALAAYYADGLRVVAGLKIGAAFNGILLLGNGSTDDIRVEGNDLRNCTNGAFNPQGSFGPNVWLLGNDGVLDWQQPLYQAPTGIAPRGQAIMAHVPNANRRLLLTAGNGDAAAVDTETGPLKLRAGGVTGIQVGTDGMVSIAAGLSVGTTLTVPSLQTLTGSLSLAPANGNVILNSTGSAVMTLQSQTGAVLRLVRFSSDPFDSSVKFGKARGSLAAPVAAQAGDFCGGNLYEFYGATGWREAAFFGVVADGPVTDTSSPGRMIFRTTPPGSIVSIERMRLGADGTISLGLGSGTESLRVLSVAAANRYVTITGSNAGRSAIGTTAGGLSFTPGGVQALSLGAVASAVNNAVITPTVAGGSPTYGVEGPDANIAMAFANKGTAVTSFAGQTVSGPAALPGTTAGFWTININGVNRQVPYY